MRTLILKFDNRQFVQRLAYVEARNLSVSDVALMEGGDISGVS